MAREDYKQKFEKLLEETIENAEEPVMKEEGQGVEQAGPITSDIKARRTLSGHLGKVYAFDWSKDSTRVVSASEDNKMIVWNPLTGEKLCAVSLKCGWVMDCSFSPSGNIVASSGLDNICAVFNTSIGPTVNQPSREIDGHDGCVSGCSFMSEEEILTCSGDHTSALWDITNGKKKNEFIGHVADVMDLSISESKNVFLTAASDRTVKLWDTRTSGCNATFTGHESDVNVVKFMSNGTVFASGSEDGTIRIGDIRTSGPLGILSIPDMESSVMGLTFSHSGRIIYACYEDTSFFVWDCIKEKRVAVIDAHENRISGIAVNNEGTALCTSSWDSKLKVWA
eukprot:GHVP01061732.1.p1 GENE.GHVP01061732.1~~GHVP01061732.1.p1  ORF type:complete len:339 (+),score=56.93 GHVP01061732.1:3-1019(+)